MELDRPPKRPLMSRIKERLENAFGKKKPAPAVPEGAAPRRDEKKKQIVAAQSLEDMVLDKVVFEKALAQLSAKEQEAVRLVYVEHKSLSEAAKELGISDSAVRGRLDRAYNEIHFRMRSI